MMDVARIARRIAAVAAVIAATAAAVSAEESRLDVVLKRDKLIVGSYSTSPPMAFVDKDGKLTGFEIELARLIAKSLLGDPNKIEFVTVTAEGRFPAVLSGKVDFGIAATTIYPERAVRVAFTEPYMDSASALIVRKDSNVRSLADVNNENMTVAALNTPVARDSATQYFPKAKLSNFETPSALFLALKSGRVQGVYADKPILDYYALQNDEFRVLPELLTEVMGNAIFVKPGDFQWWLFLDTTIKEYRYNSRYADYRDLYRRWFGRDPAPQRFYLPERTAK
jgi:polar amino acid transport system substrate-binding protein